VRNRRRPRRDRPGNLASYGHEVDFAAHLEIAGRVLAMRNQRRVAVSVHRAVDEVMSCFHQAGFAQRR